MHWTSVWITVRALLYGRVTEGAVAGMLAKMMKYSTLLISAVQETYGNKINETTADDVDKTTLYADAVKLCDDIIAGVYGTYKLEECFPAVFTKRKNEIMFSVLAEEGVGTGNKNNLWGLPVKVNTEQPVEAILLRG